MKFLTKNTGLALAMLVAVAPAMAMQTQKPASKQTTFGSLRKFWKKKEQPLQQENNAQAFAQEAQKTKGIKQSLADLKDADLQKLKAALELSIQNDPQNKAGHQSALNTVCAEISARVMKSKPKDATTAMNNQQAVEITNLKNELVRYTNEDLGLIKKDAEEMLKQDLGAKTKQTYALTRDMVDVELQARNAAAAGLADDYKTAKVADLYKLHRDIRTNKSAAAQAVNVQVLPVLEKEMATRSFAEKMRSLNPYAMKDAMWMDRSKKQRALMITAAVAATGLTVAGIVALVKILSKNELQKNEAALSKVKKAAEYANEARAISETMADISDTYVADAVKKADSALTLLSAELKNELAARAIVIDEATAEEVEAKTDEFNAFIETCMQTVSEQAEAQKETKEGFFAKMKNKLFGAKSTEEEIAA